MSWLLVAKGGACLPSNEPFSSMPLLAERVERKDTSFRL